MSMPPLIEVIPGPPGAQDYPPPPPDRPPRYRRALLFLGLFALCLSGSLAYVWSRTPLYQATASVLTVAPEEAGQPEAKTATIRQGRAQKPGMLAELRLTEPDSGQPAGGSEHVNLQRQILLGVPVFEETLRRLKEQGDMPELAALTVAHLHTLLSVGLVSDTNMVELKAEGPNPAILAPLVNAWVDAYQALREKTVRNAASTNRTVLEEEARQLEQKIEAKREALSNFRETHNILSDTGADNSPMLRLKGLNDALNKAIDEQAKANGKLGSVRAAIARGQPVLPKEEAGSVANLEKRAQELRELKKDMERRFTPGYQAMNPQLKQIPEQLAQVEAELRNKVESGSRSMLNQAEQDYAAAQQAVSELRFKIDGLKREASEFTKRFAEQETMKQDLDRLEEMNRETKAKLAKAETKPEDPYPPIQVVERAYPPIEAAWPNYWRDSGISLGLSLLVSLALVWLYDFLLRMEESPAAAPAAMPSFQFFNLHGGGLPGPQPETPANLPKQAAPLALESNPLARELSSQEVGVLWVGADRETRYWIGLLLSGLSVEEALALSEESFDRAENRIRLGVGRPRELPLAPRLKTALIQPLPEGDAEEVSARIHLIAVDAGLPSPDSVSAESIRHTYITYLVRQGIRLSELERVIGKLPAKNLAAYSRYSPPGPGLPADQVALVYPALMD